MAKRQPRSAGKRSSGHKGPVTVKKYKPSDLRKASKKAAGK